MRRKASLPPPSPPVLFKEAYRAWNYRDITGQAADRRASCERFIRDCLAAARIPAADWPEWLCAECASVTPNPEV